MRHSEFIEATYRPVQQVIKQEIDIIKYDLADTNINLTRTSITENSPRITYETKKKSVLEENERKQLQDTK